MWCGRAMRWTRYEPPRSYVNLRTTANTQTHIHTWTTVENVCFTRAHDIGHYNDCMRCTIFLTATKFGMLSLVRFQLVNTSNELSNANQKWALMSCDGFFFLPTMSWWTELYCVYMASFEMVVTHQHDSSDESYADRNNKTVISKWPSSFHQTHKKT